MDITEGLNSYSMGEELGYISVWSIFEEKWASLVAQMIKNLPPMRETWVRSLGQENPLEKGMATHSSTLAWRIPWIEKPGGLQTHTHKFYLIVE